MKQFIIFMCLLCSTNVIAQDEIVKRYGSKPGIKGILESGYTIGVGKNHEGRISLLATIGYQFNPYIFAGAGSGENYFHDSKLYGIPIYGAFRVTIPNYWISAYIDTKIGTSIADVKGLFFRPSVGCRLGASKNTAFTLGIGYELQKTSENSINMNGITIKVGFDF